MTRKIVRDIEPKKTLRPEVAPPHAPAEQKKASPYILDLSQKTIVNLTDTKSPTDIRTINNNDTNPQDATMLVAQKTKPSSLFLQLSGIAIMGLVIIFLLNTARSYTEGQKLFAKVAQSAKNGYSQLVQGGEQAQKKNINATRNMFEEAYVQFQSAQEQIWFLKNEPSLARYTAILESGRRLAESGKEMVAIMDRIKTTPDMFANTLSNQATAKTTPHKNALTELQEIYPKILTVEQNIATSLQSFYTIASEVPAHYRAAFSHGTEVLQKAHDLLSNILQIFPGLITMMGGQDNQNNQDNPNSSHRTIILLQNADEVRPTGGFIGSFINLEMQNGTIKELKLEDVYTLDDRFKQTITPPPEVQKLSGSWFMRDANYSPDFRTSGERTLWFYEQESGKTADTILAVNHQFLGKILAIIGPVDIGLPQPLTSENYREVITYMVETKKSGYEDPKKILKDLLPVIQQRLFQPAHMEQFQQLLLEEIVEKNLIGYSRHASAQTMFATLGMDGTLQSEQRDEDYLAVIASSFSGNKSDAAIKQELTHDTVVETNGEIYNQLTIKRTHQWSSASEQKWKKILRPFNFTDFPEHYLQIFGKGDNKVAMRVYVPSGSQLISADHLPIDAIKTMRDADLERSYFSFDVITKPGETSTATIRYKLPFSMSNIFANTYTLNVQKQLGAPSSSLTKHIQLGNFMSFTSAYPEGFMSEPDGTLTIGKSLNHDQRLSVLMTRHSLKR